MAPALLVAPADWRLPLAESDSPIEPGPMELPGHSFSRRTQSSVWQARERFHPDRG
jgi:hypothetical protein